MVFIVVSTTERPDADTLPHTHPHTHIHTHTHPHTYTHTHTHTYTHTHPHTYTHHLKLIAISASPYYAAAPIISKFQLKIHFLRKFTLLVTYGGNPEISNRH